ncbi:DUF3265 domain-containing protein [Vibrio parahaemolyticus]|nr:DUF3265 domain-containing protein [Vibrio parahaemolyticus]
MSCALTKCSRGIRNAWHFYYALNLVIKVVAATSVLRCSPLNMALYALGISEQDVFDTSNIGCYLPVI